MIGILDYNNENACNFSYLFPDPVNIRKFHLLSPVDGFYEYEQRSTQYFINVVPYYNAIPWYIIRMCTKLYSAQNNVKLETYIGTYGIMKLPHSNGSLVPIYMDYITNKIPVPELLWKVVYDRKNNAGVTFIGINNYLLTGKYIPLCNDISSQLHWITDFVKDYVYACTIEDWYRIVSKSFPNVSVKKILSANISLPDDYFSSPRKRNWNLFQKV